MSITPSASLELFAAVAALPGRALVLDGEVAIYAEQLRSRVEWRREPDPDAIASPPLSMVFDLLYHDRGTTTDDERSSDRTVVVSQSSKSASISGR